MIIFNDGKSGVGEHQTEDLVLENNAIYNKNGKMGVYTDISTPTTNSPLRVENRTIYATGHMALYNMQGILVAQGKDKITAPCGGIYIVIHNNQATRIGLQ